MNDIVSCMSYIHLTNIIYRDLKVEKLISSIMILILNFRREYEQFDKFMKRILLIIIQNSVYEKKKIIKTSK